VVANENPGFGVSADASILHAGHLARRSRVNHALRVTVEERQVQCMIDLNRRIPSGNLRTCIDKEVLRPEPRLIIAGAGYVAQALARLASTLDFRIVVVDDRRDLADLVVFEEKVQLTFGDIPQTIHELEPDESSWIVIVTRGHHLDKDALKAALETNAAYIGMIGSPSKVRRIFKDLLTEGIARERLEQVHAPIGLDLGGETPDEIALSIAAEMLMIRKKGSGSSLKTLHRLLDDELVVESR